MNFATWLNTFVEEKGLDTERHLEVEGPSGLNIIPLGVLLDAIKAAPRHERAAIKRTIVVIDFKHGDVMHYFRHLAQAIAK